MDISKKQIESSIILNKDTGLYEIKLPGIRRQFEGIYYSYKGVNKSFGKFVGKFENHDLNNILVGISTYNNYYIICFINLDNLSSKYYFTKLYDFFDVNIENKNYNIFVYENFNSEKKYVTEYSGSDFTFEIKNNNFKVKNAIFGTDIFNKNITFNNKIIENLNVFQANINDKYIDIADFFIYDDYFIKSEQSNYDDFYNFLEIIHNKSLQAGKDSIILIKTNIYDNIFYPKIKINLSVSGEKNKETYLHNFRKLLLTFFSENIVCYLINDKRMEEIFSSYINDFTHLEINQLNLDFDIPNNIFNFNENYDKLKIDFLKLRYNLFLLKQVHKFKNNNNYNPEGKNNLYYKLSENRLSLYFNDIEKIIDNYEKQLLKLLKVLKLKFK